MTHDITLHTGMALDHQQPFELHTTPNYVTTVGLVFTRLNPSKNLNRFLLMLLRPFPRNVINQSRRNVS